MANVTFDAESSSGWDNSDDDEYAPPVKKNTVLEPEAEMEPEPEPEVIKPAKYKKTNVYNTSSALFTCMKVRSVFAGKVFATRGAALAKLDSLTAEDLSILLTDDGIYLKTLAVAPNENIGLTSVEEVNMIKTLCKQHKFQVKWKRWQELSRTPETNHPEISGLDEEKKIFGSVPGCIFLSTKLANASKIPSTASGKTARPAKTQSVSEPVQHQATPEPEVQPRATPVKRRRARKPATASPAPTPDASTTTTNTTTPSITVDPVVPSPLGRTKRRRTSTIASTRSPVPVDTVDASSAVAAVRPASDITCDITIRGAPLSVAATLLASCAPAL